MKTYRHGKNKSRRIAKMLKRNQTSVDRGYGHALSTDTILRLKTGQY